MPINKFTTLLDLARQAKILTGETATFDGKIQLGIPFSGYPTGVDTGTTVSLGVVGSETAIFSGGTGTTVFDVANSASPNYSPLFNGFSGNVWTNPLFSGNTSGLTLPITPLSAETQIVGPVWVVTQTGMTGDYVIDTQYTGYTITYSFTFGGDVPTTAYTSYSGFTTATQENFSAGTLDYKGPLDYIATKEDASVEGRLTTNKLTVTGGASVGTLGYVLTQTGDTGEVGWVFNSASATTNTFVSGGTLNGTNLDLILNTGSSVPSIDLSGLEFTGNTSGDCITDLYISNLYGCSPIIVHDELVMINSTYPNKKLYTNLSTSGESTFNISGYTEDISELSVYSDLSKNLRFGVVGSNVVESYPFGISEDAYIYSNEYNKSLNIISNYEVVCPNGFDVLGENCVSTTAATTVSADTIINATTSVAYNKYGVRFCIPGTYETCGSGATLSNYYDIGFFSGNSIPFWGTDPGTDGRLNDIGVWVNEPPVIEDEWIGFSRCITAATDGQYLIGLAGDNGIRFSVDGELLVENPWDGTVGSGYNFWRYWVWPIDLIAGEHSIVLEGYDEGGIASFGCEIVGPYPSGTFTTNTDFEIFTGTTGIDSYTANTIFKSSDEVGNTFDTQANTCPSGYTYDICSELCVKYESPTLSGKTGDVKIYAGKTITDGGTPDLFIKGKTINRGNIGINNGDPTSKLDISGTTGYQQLRLRNSYTPTTSGDTNGEVGDISWDDNYIYVKTNSGWGRSSLDYGF
jgi:hypothetical protein